MLVSFFLCGGCTAKTLCCSNEPPDKRIDNCLSFNKFSISSLGAGIFISLTFMVVGIIGVLTIQHSAVGFLICGALLLDGLAGFFLNICTTGIINSIQHDLKVKLAEIEIKKAINQPSNQGKGI